VTGSRVLYGMARRYKFGKELYRFFCLIYIFFVWNGEKAQILKSTLYSFLFLHRVFVIFVWNGEKTQIL
jgi:hypothetical protein